MGERWDVVVAGGGLAGLTAAAVAAEAGKQVLLLERGDAFGGRAHSQVWQGFHLNAGAHALYKGGAGWAVLQSLGVRLEGAEPRLKGRGLRHGRLGLLPSGPLSLLASRLLGWKEKGAFLSLMSRLPKVDLEAAAGLTAAQWLERNVPDPGLRRMMAAVFAVSAYTADLEHLRGDIPIRRVLESRDGVFYLHEGWGALVGALARRAEGAGATLRAGTGVHRLEPAGDGFLLRLKDGGAIETSDVVLALGPAETEALLPPEAAARLRHRLGGARPATATCLDLCLSRLPHPEVNFGIGIDEAMLMTAQSETARLAPPGAALVHLVRYHEGRAGEDPSGMRARLEAFMDLLQPGWRDVLLHARALPAITVAHVLPGPGRMPIVSEDLRLPGLHLAGDWVGSEGWLADASLASGQQAGLAAARRLAACA